MAGTQGLRAWKLQLEHRGISGSLGSREQSKDTLAKPGDAARQEGAEKMMQGGKGGLAKRSGKKGREKCFFCLSRAEFPLLKSVGMSEDVSLFVHSFFHNTNY